MKDPAPKTRFPVKLHRRVAIVVCEDAALAEELLARKKSARSRRPAVRDCLARPSRAD